MSIFRSGDVRGRYPDQVDESMAFSLGRFLRARLGSQATIALARDTRTSGESLLEALASGLSGRGHSLIDLGVVPKEVASYALVAHIADLAVVVTASHHPSDMNGFKILERPGAVANLEGVVQAFSDWLPSAGNLDRSTSERAPLVQLDLKEPYVDWLIAQVPVPETINPLLACGLGGTASMVADLLIEKLGWDVAKDQWSSEALTDEGPDPRLPENLKRIAHGIASNKMSWGVAWDGDCDRCTFFDRDGNEIATPYINQMLIEAMDASAVPNCVSDGRSIFNAEVAVARRGGRLNLVESGSVWVRRAMMQSGAAYGMESSSHHYFSELLGYDSGFLTFLKTISALSRWDGDIQIARSACRADARCLAEITIPELSMDRALDRLEHAVGRFRTRGTELSSQVVFREAGDWRVSLQASKTESALRMNVETKNASRSLEALGEEFLAAMQVTLDVSLEPTEARTSRHALIAL